MIHVSKLNDAKAVSEIEFRKLTVSCPQTSLIYYPRSTLEVCLCLPIMRATCSDAPCRCEAVNKFHQKDKKGTHINLPRKDKKIKKIL